MPTIAPPSLLPQSQGQLLAQIRQLASYSLDELAALAEIPIPRNLKRDKGWTGILLELQLSVNAGSKPEQDFVVLGVEPKTIPIDSRGRLLETIFVCIAPLTGDSGVTWESNHVRHKLQHVLWIPVEGECIIPLVVRRVGIPLLWSPDEDKERQLRMDWEKLMDLIVLGEVERIIARHGEMLQLGPKATNSKALTEAISAHGEMTLALPRGLHLRKNFTATLLVRRFLLQHDQFFVLRQGLHITAAFYFAGLWIMLFVWITDPNTWLALSTLTLLEVVLGIDSIIFLFLIVVELPTARRAHARRIGLMGAVVIRLALLTSTAWVVKLTNPLFTVLGQEISFRDLILLLGGLFLIRKTSKEIRESIEDGEGGLKANVHSLLGAIVQIMLLDVISSLDSVITAVGLLDHLFIMMAAMVIVVGMMTFIVRPIGDFVDRHSLVEMLTLSLLIFVGFTPMLKSFDVYVPKGYIYSTMFFSIAVESPGLLRNKRNPLQTIKLQPGHRLQPFFRPHCFLCLASRAVNRQVWSAATQEAMTMKKRAALISAIGLAFSVSGCNNNYIIAIKDRRMILTGGKSTTDDDIDLTSYKDQQGNRIQINRDGVS